MIRWLSIGVITYMIAGIIWWGMLLHQKNEQIFNLQSSTTKSVLSTEDIEKERKRQTSMIFGEGLVLVSLLLLGIYIIDRSANREITAAKQQNDFLLSVSHELKSPIAAIKLALQTLSRNELPKVKQSKFIGSALKDSNRLEQLVQNILLTTNIDSNPLELYKSDVDIVQLIHQLINKHDSQATIQIQSSSNHLIIQGDQMILQQAIRNVIDNAIKYGSQPLQISIDIKQMNGQVICEISNSGESIPKEQLKNIFDKFYRGDIQEIRKKEGTGIGLYITKEIIEAHGGSISAVSADGVNTFKINLPING